MNKRLTMALAGCLLSGAAIAGTGAHWTYDGHEGPEHWGELAPEYTVCAMGKNQSPIDLDGFTSAKLTPIKFNYDVPAKDILNNGHTIQANFGPGDSITVDGKVFDLIQVHFHTPSENHIRGKSFPMEGHLVHADKDGNLAVVAVMFVEGKENAGIAKLWQQMPEEADTKTPLTSSVKPGDLLPKDRTYYRFNGSLTTPPCSEGVRWLVMKHPVSVSKEQVERFAHVMHHPNNRPVQPVNARPVLQ